jgi:membrane-associated protease RseP (regulator of RpoE activity)
MRTSMIGSFAAMVLALAIAPAAVAQKEVHRTVIVKDGQIFTSDGTAAHLQRLRARGFLGVQMIDLTPELREHFKVQKDAGVLVSKVVPDSPAAKAGIRVGDIITAIDGSGVDSPGDVTRVVRDKKKGDTVRIEYSRDGVKATGTAGVVERERKEIDLRDLDIQIPDIPDIRIPDVAMHLDRYFNSPEWKVKMERLKNLPDCGDMQERMRKIESKMNDLQKRLGQK